ncbi:MAG: helix-turn-helix domain-containing protein [Candidatus Bathyarchaeia archaeon]|jgi:sugar-specific transcriptional regulator TrmB
MKSSDEYISTLSEMGLSVSQAKVYLSLAKSRSLKAHEISSISGVSRPDVYRVLVQLEEAGIVERTISKPEVFHAISIEKCVSNLIQRRIMKTAELEAKALTLTQNFKRINENEELSEEFQFMLIPCRSAVYAKAEKMIRSVQEIICFMALRRRLIAWVSNYLPILEEALTKKVDFRVIMPKPEVNEQFGEPLETLMKYPNFAIKLISGAPNVGFSVWDRKEMLLSTSAIDSPFPHPTVWSNNKCAVDLSQDYFDLIWQKAQKTKTKKRKMAMEDIATFV